VRQKFHGIGAGIGDRIDICMRRAETAVVSLSNFSYD
jgi:hypothetical protein